MQKYLLRCKKERVRFTRQQNQPVLENDDRASNKICYGIKVYYSSKDKRFHFLAKDVIVDPPPDMEEERSPVAVLRTRQAERIVTREDMWCEANNLARTWANELQDLPFPSLEGQFTAMRKLIEAARSHQVPQINLDGNFNASILYV